MNTQSAVPALLAAGLLALTIAPGIAPAADPPPTDNRSTSLPPGDANVPLDASQSEDDLKVTRDIRSAMSADGSLSASVRESVRVATNGQAVVLRGALPTVGDIDRVASLAQQYAGARQIVNQLTVADNAGPPAALDRRR